MSKKLRKCDDGLSLPEFRHIESRRTAIGMKRGCELRKHSRRFVEETDDARKGELEIIFTISLL